MSAGPIAEEKNLKKAANKLHFSHPTIYRPLAALEAGVASSLLSRRGLTTTAYVPTLRARTRTWVEAPKRKKKK